MDARSGTGLEAPLLKINTLEDKGSEYRCHGSGVDMRLILPVLPFLRNVSGKWRFKHHEYLAEKVFEECHQLSPGMREYNRVQRETLAGFREVDIVSAGLPESSTSLESSEELRGQESLAVLLSNLFNVVLLIVKVYASVKSHSLAVVASTLDSLLDLLAGAVLWLAHRSMQMKNQYKYPIGKLRLQPVGIVIFAAIMASLGMQVLVTGVQQLVDGDKSSIMTKGERIWLISIMGTASVIKLVLFLYCHSFDDAIVKAYSKDHLFDVITNAAGLVSALLAEAYFWWIDPAGAILIALYTIINWSKTVLENAASLVGQAAPPQLLQKLTYMAFNHHAQIVHIDTVRAYTFGTLYFVEVDIELPENMPLRDAHNIGENLQNKLEALAEVERAFVHLDYESRHKPEHDVIGKANK